MDLSVHRAIVYLALKRAELRLGKDLTKAFYPIWLGNWLVDMNQATEFFDVLENQTYDRNLRYSGIDGLDDGECKLPEIVKDYKTEWVGMFKSLWNLEWESCQKTPVFSLMPETPKLDPKNIQRIGAYVPYDHFDVADVFKIKMVKGKETLEPVSLPKEFKDRDNIKVTATAETGIHEYTYNTWLRPAFAGNGSSRQTDHDQLIWLGHASHTMADFFAHSNFIEILIRSMARLGRLPSDLVEALRREEYGSYRSYHRAEDPYDSWLMTGRFDWQDTFVSILKIYRGHLIEHWEDLHASGTVAKAAQKDRPDAVFQVLFGTFSHRPWAPEIIGAAKVINKVNKFIGAIGKFAKDVGIHFAAWVARKKFTSKREKEMINNVRDLLKKSTSKKAKDYIMAGRLLYLENVIAAKLQKDLDEATNFPILPHHTLLAKDNDVGHPECRLAYKLACCMAVDVTTELFVSFFSGQKLDSDFQPVLQRYYRHPRDIVTSQEFQRSVFDAAAELYGVRWWLFADKEEARFLVP